MKLTYWISECLSDSHAYNIRARRRKDVVAALEAEGIGPEGGRSPGPYSIEYGPVRKVEVEYKDGFDLMQMCLSEGSGSWEVEL